MRLDPSGNQHPSRQLHDRPNEMGHQRRLSGYPGDWAVDRGKSSPHLIETADIKRMSRIKLAFGALIVTQIAHSTEEYVGGLWESFPPARFLTGMISSDHEFGFIVLNVALAVFGLWCLLFPVRKEWPSAIGFIWFWVVLEIINGIGHPAWTLREGGYTPGVLTAPILLVLALYLAAQMRKRGRPEAGPVSSN
jgi:hypothetical protein